MAARRTTAKTEWLRVVWYVRISSDPSGLEEGVDRQEKDCRALADALGWQVVRVFRENDTSAYKQKTITRSTGERARRVIRPQFWELLALLGRWGADAMVAYDLDRGVRDPRDLEDLIDTKVLAGFQVRSTTGSLRLENDADIAMARVLVVMANKSSADTARRVKRASQQQAEDGRWHGGMAPFGYRMKDSTLLPVPEHAALVRQPHSGSPPSSLSSASIPVAGGPSVRALLSKPLWGGAGTVAGPVNVSRCPVSPLRPTGCRARIRVGD